MGQQVETWKHVSLKSWLITISFCGKTLDLKYPSLKTTTPTKKQQENETGTFSKEGV